MTKASVQTAGKPLPKASPPGRTRCWPLTESALQDLPVFPSQDMPPRTYVTTEPRAGGNPFLVPPSQVQVPVLSGSGTLTRGRGPPAQPPPALRQPPGTLLCPADQAQATAGSRFPPPSGKAGATMPELPIQGWTEAPASSSIISRWESARDTTGCPQQDMGSQGWP